MSDVIKLTAEIAYTLYENGLITRADLTRTLEKCINAASIDNGHTKPFPDTKFDDSDLETESKEVK